MNFLVYELNLNKTVNIKKSTMIEGELNSKLRHLEKKIHKCVEIKLELKYIGLGLLEF